MKILSSIIFSVSLVAIFVIFPNTTSAISGACSYHSGVNCGIVSYEGYAMCNDGWVSSTRYADTDECRTSPRNCQYPSIPCDLAGLNGLYVMNGLSGSSEAEAGIAACKQKLENYQSYINAYNQCLNSFTPPLSPVVESAGDFQRSLDNICNAKGYENSTFDQQVGRCICMPEYTNYGGTCKSAIERRLDCYAQLGNGVDMANMVNNNICSCQSGYVQNKNTLKCEVIIPEKIFVTPIEQKFSPSPSPVFIAPAPKPKIIKVRKENIPNSTTAVISTTTQNTTLITEKIVTNIPPQPVLRTKPQSVWGQMIKWLKFW